MAGTESDILWLISPTRGGRLLWSRQNTLPFGRDFMGGRLVSRLFGIVFVTAMHC